MVGRQILLHCRQLHLPIAESILHANYEKEASVKKRFVIYPFLFGIFFVLALYSANVTEVSLSQALPPLIVVVAGTVVILLLAWLLLRDIRKAA